MSDEVDQFLNELKERLGLRGFKTVGAGEGLNGGAREIRVTMDRTIDQRILNDALSSNDELKVVLFYAMEIELQLNDFLEATGLSAPRDFGAGCLKLEALRFDNGVFEIVDGFRRLRNKFAHKKDASLNNHKEILSSIFDQPLPNFQDTPVVNVRGPENASSIPIADLPPIHRLAVYGDLTLLFLAAANQFFDFPKPFQKVVLTIGDKG